MQRLAEAVGFPEDQLRYVVCLFGAIAVAPVFRMLPSPGLKHIFSIVFSVSCCLFCLGPLSWIHSFGSALVTYALMKFAPRNRSHVLVFVWAFGYMSASHLYRMYIDYMGWTLDFTGPQMVLTLKLIAVAFCYSDGVRTDLSPEQKKRSIANLPPLLDFFGYVYFYPSFLAGPHCEFTDYQRFVSGAVFYDDVCNGKCPSTLVPTLKALGIGLTNMGLIVVFGGQFGLDKLLATYEARSESLAMAALRFFVSPFLLRCRYYFGWKVAEAAFCGCGFAYNGKGVDKDPSQIQKIWRAIFGEPKPEILWDRATNVRISSVDLGTNLREVSIYWNKKTGEWLRDYIYTRVSPKLIDPTLATFVVSAFWHGFYPGYYLYFVYLSLVVSVSREVRRVVRPIFQGTAATRVLYDVITTFVTVCILNYSGIGFALLGWERNVRVFNSLYWVGHVAIGALFALVTLRSLGGGKKERRGDAASKSPAVAGAAVVKKEA